MPATLSSHASSLIELSLLEPARARERWLRWRAGVDLNDVDADCLALLPMLPQLAEWIAEGDPDAGRLLGICKRGWAHNQMRNRELVTVWTLLQEGGILPVAIGGDAALALVYAEERSVRPIETIEVVLARAHVPLAIQLLAAGGWTLEPHMPQPEGRVFDEYDGLWFRSSSSAALCVRWRLPQAAPAFAAESETLPATTAAELLGTSLALLAPEELLLEVLTRTYGVVDWRCDALMLLRNRSIDWMRLHSILRGHPPALERLARLRDEFAIAVPDIFFELRKQSRFAGWLSSYRHVAWANGEPSSFAGFVRYLCRRAFAVAGLASDVTVIDAAHPSGASRLGDYLRFRTLFLFLTLRDIRLRYRKTWRGVFWALIQPLLPMLIFAAIFARVVRPELTHGPYWLFVLTGLAPWNFFANAVNYASATFVGNFNLLNKVYFPRAMLPAASVFACLIDLVVSTAALIVLSWYMGYSPGWRLLELPLAFVAAAAVALAIGIAAASVNVLYRDLKPLVPFLVQVGMYATPVLFPLRMIPAAYRWLGWVNPMTAIVESFRSALFNTSIDWRGTGISAAAFCVVVPVAAWFFRHVEADIAERV